MTRIVDGLIANRNAAMGRAMFARNYASLWEGKYRDARSDVLALMREAGISERRASRWFNDQVSGAGKEKGNGEEEAMTTHEVAVEISPREALAIATAEAVRLLDKAIPLAGPSAPLLKDVQAHTQFAALFAKLLLVDDPPEGEYRRYLAAYLRLASALHQKETA